MKAGTTAAAGSPGSRGSRVVATVAADSPVAVTVAAALAAVTVAEVTADLWSYLSSGVCLPISGAMQLAHRGHLHTVVCDAPSLALVIWVPPTP